MNNTNALNLNKGIVKEQVLLIYQGLITAILGTLTVSVVLLCILWDSPEKSKAIYWFSSVSAVLFYRFVLYVFIHKNNWAEIKQHSIEIIYFRENLIFSGVILTAVLWGAASVIFYDPDRVGILALIMGGLAAVSTTTLSFRIKHALYFIGIVSGPLIVMLILDGSSQAFHYLLLMIILVVFSVRGAIQNYNTSTNNIRLKILHEKESKDLALSQQKLRLHVENTPLAVIEWDENFKIKDWNPSAEKIFGFTRAEALDMHFSRLLHESEKDSIKLYDHFKENGSGSKFTLYCSQKDGSLIFCDWYNTPLIDESGETIGLASMIMDITLENKILDELIDAKDETEKAVGVKSEFLSHMSHEFRTPLNSILGFCQLLELSSNAPLSEDQQLYIREIDKSGKDLLDVVGNILDLQNIDEQKVSLKIKTLDLGEILLDAVNLLSKEAVKKNIQVHIQNNLRCSIGADASRLKQVIVNVLLNGIKYNHNGGKITIKAEHSGENFCILQITDTGMGLSENEVEEVFQPFSRFGRDNVDGTGIGLTISKNLMEMMGGDIEVISQKEKGTSVRIKIMKGN